MWNRDSRSSATWFSRPSASLWERFSALSFLGDNVGKEGRRQQITTVVAYAITGAWSVSFVIDILVPSYDPPPTLTPLMLIVAGWCFSDGLMPPKRRGPTSEETDS